MLKKKTLLTSIKSKSSIKTQDLHSKIREFNALQERIEALETNLQDYDQAEGDLEEINVDLNPIE